MIPPSYLSWRNDVRGKKFLLDFISANASIINHISIGDTIAYLLNALEMEKSGSPWFIMTLKTLSDLLFTKAFEAFALTSGTCMFEATVHQYQTFACSAIPVFSINQGAKLTQVYTRLKVRLPRRHAVVCFACYRTKFLGEEVEIAPFGPLECSAKQLVAQQPSKQFAPFSGPKHVKQDVWQAFGLLKSDNVDRKMNAFTVRKAADGNVRLGDAVFSSLCLDTDQERTVRSIAVKVLSGGLKDSVTVSLLPLLEANIHTSKPPEDVPKGGVVFQFRKQQVVWYEGTKKFTQLLPTVGTNDTLQFVISSFKKVNLIQ